MHWREAPLRLELLPIRAWGIRAVRWLREHLIRAFEHEIAINLLEKIEEIVLHHSSHYPSLEAVLAALATGGVGIIGYDYYKYQRKMSLLKNIFGEPFDPSKISSNYDSGRAHEKFRPKIHPANKRALEDLTSNSQPLLKRIFALLKKDMIVNDIV